MGAYPREGSSAWYEAVARSHRRCAVHPGKFSMMTPADHLAKAAEAQSRADAAREEK